MLLGSQQTSHVEYLTTYKNNKCNKGYVFKVSQTMDVTYQLNMAQDKRNAKRIKETISF